MMQIVSNWVSAFGGWMPFVGTFEMTWEDVSGTPGNCIPPSPNLVVIQADATDAIVTAMLSDPFFQHAILWADGHRPPDEESPDAEYQGACAAFAALLSVTLDQVHAVVGPVTGGRTRRQVADGVVQYVRALPKAVTT